MNKPARASGPALRIDPETDRRFMQAAIGLGRRNNGRAWPNPSVGAIIVRDDGAGPYVVGRAVTAAGGRPHAETLALTMAGDLARGATAYVTLEPCSHHGKTPPCCEALVAAGITRVVTAGPDPDPRVAGRGHRHLEARGIRVTTGVLAREAARLHAGHFSRIRRSRPHVVLKLAVSADGFIGRRGEGQIPISSARSKAYALGLRLEHDAIMVGIGTVLADDPELTCRLPGCDNLSPVRVVIDARARTPVTSKLVTTARMVPTWVFVAPDAPAAAIRALGDAGCSVLVAERDETGRLELADVLFQLGRAGITSVVSEGGATIARSLLERDLVDEAHVVRSDLVIGDGGVPALAGLPLGRITDDPSFEVMERRSIGPDHLIHVWRREE